MQRFFYQKCKRKFILRVFRRSRSKRGRSSYLVATQRKRDRKMGKATAHMTTVRRSCAAKEKNKRRRVCSSLKGVKSPIYARWCWNETSVNGNVSVLDSFWSCFWGYVLRTYDAGDENPRNYIRGLKETSVVSVETEHAEEIEHRCLNRERQARLLGKNDHETNGYFNLKRTIACVYYVRTRVCLFINETSQENLSRRKPGRGMFRARTRYCFGSVAKKNAIWHDFIR